MKAISLTTVLVLAIVLSSCSSARLAGTGVFYDDIYYVPGLTRANIHQAFSPVPAMSKEAQKADNLALAQQRREIQRDQDRLNDEETRDYGALQEKYASLLANENITELDTLVYFNEETGYWVGGFDGSRMDRDYAERIIRFHGAFIRIPYFSPLYSELVYFNHPHYNVYVDGNYAYAFPSWSNRWYNSFFLNTWGSPFRWSTGLSWRHGWMGHGWMGHGWMGHGWYDPFFHSFHHPFYNPFWFSSAWFHHPRFHWGHGYWGDNNNNISNRAHYQGSRGGLSSNTRLAPGTAIQSSEILKRTSGIRAETTGISTRVSRDQQGNTRYETGSGTVYTRSARGGHEQVKSGTTGTEDLTSSGRAGAVRQSNTRGSFTPSYTRPDGNARPAYNRATVTRVNREIRPAQTTGTVQSTTTGTRQVQGTATGTRGNTVVNANSGDSRVTINQPRSISPRGSTERSTVVPSSTRQGTSTTYRQGSSQAPSRSSSGSVSSPLRSGGDSSPRPSMSSTPSRGSSSSGSISTSSPGGSSGSSGGTIRQGRR